MLTGRMASVRCALNGLTTLWVSQPNARLHALAAVGVLIAGLYFELVASEWCWIALAVTLVWVAEALNTALEFLADVACPEYHLLVGKAKDVAAAAVLIAAAGALTIGLLVFAPRIAGWL